MCKKEVEDGKASGTMVEPELATDSKLKVHCDVMKPTIS